MTKQPENDAAYWQDKWKQRGVVIDRLRTELAASHRRIWRCENYAHDSTRCIPTKHYPRVMPPTVTARD